MDTNEYFAIQRSKLAFIYKPFLLSLVAALCLYTFLHWLLIIELQLFELEEVYITFGGSFIIAGLLAWLVVRQPLKILHISEKVLDFYCIILMLIFFMPLIISQEYIISSTGKLTHLENVNDISKTAPSKYYSLDRCYIDKDRIGWHADFRLKGKNDEDLAMTIYIVMPIFDTLPQPTDNNTVPAAWLGCKYYKSISNNLSEEEKDQLYEQFVQSTEVDFYGKNVNNFQYLDRLSHSTDRQCYRKAIEDNQYYKTPDIVLEAVNTPYETRDEKTTFWLWISILGGCGLFFIMLLIPGIDKEKLEQYKLGQISKARKKEIQELLAIAIPNKTFFFTPLLIYINLGVFLVMMFKGLGCLSFNASDLLDWGANYRPSVESGEWWRLFTSIFLHGGLMHLLMNMYGLFFIGFFLEPLLGKLRFIAIYLLSGVLASLSSIWWHDATVSIGASGAIFGLYGAALALIWLKVFTGDISKVMLVNVAVFAGLSLLMGLGVGIDNAAHIGGLISGFVLGILCSFTMSKEKANK